MKRRNYPFDDLPCRLDKYEGIVHLIIGVIVGLIFIVLCLTDTPCQAVNKCYKDICVDQIVMVNKGLYKGNLVTILDITKEPTPDEREEQIKDYYKYFVSFMDGTITYLYRAELKIEK